MSRPLRRRPLQVGHVASTCRLVTDATAGACIVACQAENNIPIVGKDQVARGREMHWIRIDALLLVRGSPRIGWDTCAHQRRGPPARHLHAVRECSVRSRSARWRPRSTARRGRPQRHGLQPLCGNALLRRTTAPTRCGASITTTGIAAKRFASSRATCSRSRSDYLMKGSATPDDPFTPMQFNPEVTVRMRGVMEKCTYCTQRIMRGRIDAKNAYARLSDEEQATPDRRRVSGSPTTRFTTACQTRLARPMPSSSATSRTRPSSKVSPVAQAGPRSYADASRN